MGTQVALEKPPRSKSAMTPNQSLVQNLANGPSGVNVVSLVEAEIVPEQENVGSPVQTQSPLLRSQHQPTLASNLCLRAKGAIMTDVPFLLHGPNGLNALPLVMGETNEELANVCQRIPDYFAKAIPKRNNNVTSILVLCGWNGAVGPNVVIHVGVEQGKRPENVSYLMVTRLKILFVEWDQRPMKRLATLTDVRNLVHGQIGVHVQ